MTTAPLARLDGVSRTFGDVVALDDVSLDIGAGEMLGLLGPNGAGKTTLLTLLTGQRRPSAGTVQLFGGSPLDWRNRRALGTTPQESALPPTLTVREVIDLVGAHFDDRRTTAELSEEFGLTDLLRRQTGSLSGGQRRRLSVALAFVGRPRLVLLDEPTTGLDVDARRSLWDALRRQHAAGSTVVVTSHYLEEIEALAERVVVVASGRLIADAPLPDVLRRVGLGRVRLATSDDDAVRRLPDVAHVAVEDDGALVVSTRDSDAFVRELVRRDIPFEGLVVRGATLEEAFLTLTDPTARDLEVVR